LDAKIAQKTAILRICILNLLLIITLIDGNGNESIRDVDEMQ